MAAQVASQSSDGSQNRDSAAGVSYASAVLNFKNMDNNKENIIGTSVGPTPRDSMTKEVPVKSKTAGNNPQPKTGRQPNTYATASKPTTDTEDFPQINKSSSKISRRPQQSKSDRDHNNFRQKSSQSSTNCDSADSVNDSENTVKSSLNVETLEDEALNSDKVEDVPEKKKFVAAPLPKINPWTKNKNAAEVITGKSGEPQLPAPTSTPSIAEKRVLQPQQQGTVGELTLFFMSSITV